MKFNDRNDENSKKNNSPLLNQEEIKEIPNMSIDKDKKEKRMTQIDGYDSNLENSEQQILSDGKYKKLQNSNPNLHSTIYKMKKVKKKNHYRQKAKIIKKFNFYIYRTNLKGHQKLKIKKFYLRRRIRTNLRLPKNFRKNKIDETVNDQNNQVIQEAQNNIQVNQQDAAIENQNVNQIPEPNQEDIINDEGQHEMDIDEEIPQIYENIVDVDVDQDGVVLNQFNEFNPNENQIYPNIDEDEDFQQVLEHLDFFN